MAKSRTPVLAYMRTSSEANVGESKDSERRQREAIEAFARHSGHVVVERNSNRSASKLTVCFG
jgi:DNA invertase Pin-like site-specific DNA recombinase